MTRTVVTSRRTGRRSRCPGRLVIIGPLLLAACVSFTRTPVRPLPPADLLRGTSVALLDIAIALPDYPDRLERRLLSLPNEVMIKDGDHWLIVPQQDMLPVTDLTHALLRSMGVDVRRASSLYQARLAGSQVALFLSLRRSEVRLPAPRVFLAGTVTEAHAAMQLTVVDIGTGRGVWTGPLTAKVEMTPTTQLTLNPSDVGLVSGWRGPIALAESAAATPASEGTVQSARALLAQAYYDVAVQIVHVLTRAIGRTAR